MSVEVTQVNYGNYGRCIRMSNGVKELIATVEMGPCIIRYGFIGEENMFYEDIDKIATNDISASPYEGDEWWVIGGHRLWCSPEVFPRTYYPAMKEVDVKIDANTVVFTSVVQEWSQIQTAISVTMDDDGNVKLNHTVTNKNAWDIELAPWTISALAPNGMVYIPQNKSQTGFFPNKWVCYWDYTSMNDSRIGLGEDYITVAMDANKSVAAKIGVLNENGWMAFIKNGNAFVKKFGYVKGAQYPDNGCNCESYTCSAYTEAECLSPTQKIAPGATARHEEEWILKKANTIEEI